MPALSEIEGALHHSRVAWNWLIPKARCREGGCASLLSDHVIDWPATIGAAAKDFAIPALAMMLQRADLVDSVPNDVRVFLCYALSQNAQANHQLREQCLEIGRSLSAVAVTGVLLKGACWLFEDGPALQDRMLRDIDLLVPKTNLADARAALLALGYRRWSAAVTEPGNIHDAPLEHPGRRASVELHVEATPYVKYLGADEIFTQAVEVAPGLLLPCPLHRLIHNVVHAQFTNGDYVGGVLNLRDSLDLGRLIERDMSTENWISLERTARKGRFFHRLSGALHKGAYISGVELPEPFRSDRRGRRHLRRCLLQRRWPVADGLMRKFGILRRATTWERDAYALGLDTDRSLVTHLLVNRRRFGRIWAALSRETSWG